MKKMVAFDLMLVNLLLQIATDKYYTNAFMNLTIRLIWTHSIENTNLHRYN